MFGAFGSSESSASEIRQVTGAPHSARIKVSLRSTTSGPWALGLFELIGFAVFAFTGSFVIWNWLSIPSTKVVMPWSTWAVVAWMWFLGLPKNEGAGAWEH